MVKPISVYPVSESQRKEIYEQAKKENRSITKYLINLHEEHMKIIKNK